MGITEHTKYLNGYERHVDLIDTRKLCTYQDYYEYRKKHKKLPYGEDSKEFRKWYVRRCIEKIEKFFNDLSCCRYQDPVIIFGALATPKGNMAIRPLLMRSQRYGIRLNGEEGYKDPSLKRAFMKCIHGMDNFSAYMERGVIHIHGYHRDGVNRFQLYGVRKKYLKYYKNDKYFKAHPDLKFYTLKPFNKYDVFYKMKRAKRKK